MYLQVSEKVVYGLSFLSYDYYNIKLPFLYFSYRVLIMKAYPKSFEVYQ